MITKTKKNVLIVLLALLFVVSLGAIGFMTVRAETPVTAIGVKEEYFGENLYANLTETTGLGIMAGNPGEV